MPVAATVVLMATLVTVAVAMPMAAISSDMLVTASATTLNVLILVCCAMHMPSAMSSTTRAGSILFVVGPTNDRRCMAVIMRASASVLCTAVTGIFKLVGVPLVAAVAAADPPVHASAAPSAAMTFDFVLQPLGQRLASATVPSATPALLGFIGMTVFMTRAALACVPVCAHGCPRAKTHTPS